MAKALLVALLLIMSPVALSADTREDDFNLFTAAVVGDEIGARVA